MKIAIIRSDVRDVCSNKYNNQEIGLSKSLSTLGYEIDIITPWQENKTINIAPSINVLYRPYTKIPVLNHILIKNIRKTLRQGGYDIIHCNEENMSSTLYYYLNRLNARFIIYHGMYKVLNSKALRIYEKFHNAIASKIMKSTLVFTKTQEASNFIKLKKYKTVEVLPIGLDTENLTPVHQKNSPRNKTVLYIGVLEERRNIKFIIQLAQRMPNFNFTIIGTGPEKDNVTQAISTKALKNIELIDPVAQKDLYQYYSNADVFILPSDFEIFGMVLLEALYYDLPILSTPTAGAIDIVDKRAGITAELNIEDWAKHIDFISSHRGDYSPREVYVEKYQWQVIAEQYHKTICSTAK